MAVVPLVITAMCGKVMRYERLDERYNDDSTHDNYIEITLGGEEAHKSKHIVSACREEKR